MQTPRRSERTPDGRRYNPPEAPGFPIPTLRADFIQAAESAQASAEQLLEAMERTERAIRVNRIRPSTSERVEEQARRGRSPLGDLPDFTDITYEDNVDPPQVRVHVEYDDDGSARYVVDEPGDAVT
jgi:hypothetical protein